MVFETNMGGQCFNSLSKPLTSSSSRSVIHDNVIVNLTPGQYDFTTSPTATSQGNLQFESATGQFRYKIYRRKMYSSSMADYYFMDWWACDGSGLRLEAPVTIGTVLSVKPGDLAQKILVGSMGLNKQTLPDYACRDQMPSAKDSSYTVSFEGGPLNAKETQLDFKETRYIANKEDCAIRGIEDATTCTAYMILSSMTKFTWPDLPLYNFYLFVPAHDVSYEKIKLRFSKVTWIWDQGIGSMEMNYMIYFEPSVIAMVVKATVGPRSP